jgi:ribosomal protein S18 acetylase RimI-like enzyme
MKLLSKNINPQSEHFNNIYQLYQEAFPEDERRSLAQLINCFNNTKYKLTGFWLTNNFVGFIEYWNFDSFIFVEHIAVSENFRGKSIGKKIMQTILKQDIPIYLEIELAIDEISKKRLGFYQNLNFEKLPIKYFQPAYSSEKRSIEMHLMAFQHNSEISLKKIVYSIHTEVY